LPLEVSTSPMTSFYCLLAHSLLFLMGTPVICNVYDLHPYNKYVYWMGLGAFHAGIEVEGTEYSFGFVDSDSTGVFTCEPRQAEGATYRESMVMGYTSKSGWQIDNLVAEMKLRYRGHDYHMYLNNCITFSDDLCFQLTGAHLPAWLSRLPHIANSITCCLPKYLRGPYPVLTEDADSGNEKAPILPPKGGATLTIPVADSPSHGNPVPPAAARVLGTTTTTATTTTSSHDDGSVPNSSNSAVL